MEQKKESNYTKGMLMIILSAFCFACMNMCVRMSGALPSTQKSFFRNVVAAIFAAFFLYRQKLPLKVKKTEWLPLFLRCSAGTLGILSNFYAIDHLLVADASILNKLSPFFAIFFSFLILREKMKPAQMLCIALAFVGCIFVVKPGFQNTALFPAMIGVGGGLFAGFAYTMVRILGKRGMKGPVIVFYFSAFSSVILLPSFLGNYVPMSGRQLCILILAGLFAAGGQFTITAAYTYAPANKISIFDYSQIVFATILGFLLFGEVPDIYSFWGYGLIIFASLLMFFYNRFGSFFFWRKMSR